ncbi:MAG TPA: PKD domain-containing protein, partial [Chitinophagaceae bacterium]|nr:PKD domain-containing protein [Chitinophagaceae bacterium]
FSILLIGVHSIARADHITGGEMFYTYLGKNGSENKYQVTLKLFMRCNSGRRFNDPTTVAVFDRLSNARVKDISVPLSRQENIRLNNSNPCITNPPDVCYDVAYYEFTVSLPPNENGYLLVSQVNYRIAGINNLSQGYGQIGATYTAEIPGTSGNGAPVINNSAQFTGSDLVIVCASNSFSYSFAAKDADGDRLQYAFGPAYVSGTSGTNVSPPQPPYPSVPYGQGFDGSSPLGSNVKLSSTTGLITGIAPQPGVYVVTVYVQEIRNGTVIATQRKDLQINITECSIAAASLLPEYQVCTESKTLSVANLSNSPLISSYSWQIFTNDGTHVYSSASSAISYSFADTGLYSIQLHINEGQECSDSATSLIRVYPGLQAAFAYSGICVGKPTAFSNAAQTVYGTITSSSWDFGEAGDTSHAVNPLYTYTQTGTKNVSLVVTTSKGCRDTVLKSVSIVDKPPLDLLFRDTLICKGDTLQLHAAGNGIFSWSSPSNIINAGTAAPLVHPPVTTKYMVELDDNGCKARDSLQVNVVDFVNLVARPDTVICEKDEVQLGATTNGLQFSWLPAATVNNAGLLNAVARPDGTTTYRLTAVIGHCKATDEVTVNVVPYPKVAAGFDTLICYNSRCQLNGFTDGSSVIWSPPQTLDQPTALNPVARPTGTTAYILSAFDTKGCPKPAYDTVLITVLPQIFPGAGTDTAVVIGQPLQLNASGGLRYLWSPDFNLSSATISNPVAVFNEASEGLLYKVLVFNEAGCVDSDFLHIKVYQTDPTVFIPNAFTPNADGKNDLLRPIATGITKIEYFRIYN